MIENRELAAEIRAHRDPQRIAVGVPDTPFSLMEGSATAEILFYHSCLNPLISGFPAYDL